MTGHHREATSALNPTVNAQDTTVLFQRPEGDYLLVAATSARTAARALIDAVAERSERAAPLHERARRRWKIARAVKIVSLAIALAGTAVVLLHFARGVPENLTVFAGIAALGGGVGYIFIGGLVAEEWSRSASNRAAEIERVPAVELLGGVHLPTPNVDWITPRGDWIRSRHPLPDGSLLIRLEEESRTLRMAAESLTEEQRDEVVALVKNDLVGEAVTEVVRIGRGEKERRTQTVLREARGKRHAGKRPLLRALKGRD